MAGGSIANQAAVARHEFSNDSQARVSPALNGLVVRARARAKSNHVKPATAEVAILLAFHPQIVLSIYCQLI